MVKGMQGVLEAYVGDEVTQLDPAEERERKPQGYWRNLDNLLKEAEKIPRENGRLPSQKRLDELGFGSFTVSAVKYHGGLVRIRELLGEKLKRTGNGNWSKLEYALLQARNILQEHDLTELPNSDELRKLGYSDLANAISRYHGGFGKFRKKLGHKELKTPDGKWNNFDYLMKQIRVVMFENDWEDLPSPDQLSKIRRTDIVNAVYRYHKGFSGLRERLGEEEKRIANGLWKKLEYTIQRTLEFLKTEGIDDLPSQNYLFGRGESSLVAAIKRYHGGFPVFRETLRVYLGKSFEESKLEDTLESYVGDRKSDEN